MFDLKQIADSTPAFAKRVQQALRKSGLSQTDAARRMSNRLGKTIKPQVIQYMASKAERSTYAVDLAVECGVSPNWLSSGAGNMTDVFIGESTPEYLPDTHVLVGQAHHSDEWIYVPRVTGGKLSAGSGEILWEIDEEINAVAFRLDWMQAKGLKPSRCKVWRVRGDSMDPRYSNGDSLLIDMSDRQPKHGKFYALIGEDGLRVKQLRATNQGGWEMYSINADKDRYPTEPIVQGNYEIIGRVRGRSGDED